MGELAGREPIDSDRCSTFADGLAVRVAIPLAVAELNPLVQRFELVSEPELEEAVRRMRLRASGSRARPPRRSRSRAARAAASACSDRHRPERRRRPLRPDSHPPNVESRALQRLLTTATLVGLLVATAAAFAITERLKLTKSPIYGTRVSRRRLLADVRLRPRPGEDLLQAPPRRTTSRFAMLDSQQAARCARSPTAAHAHAGLQRLPLGRP